MAPLSLSALAGTVRLNVEEQSNLQVLIALSDLMRYQEYLYKLFVLFFFGSSILTLLCL